MSGGYKTKRINELSNHNHLRKFVKLIYPPMPTLNIIPNRIILEIQSKIFKKNKNILNVGSGDNFGSGYKIWKNVPIQRFDITNLDIENGPNVDVVGDAHKLPFEDSSFDIIISQATIEHLHSPILAVSEFYRVLKPGGFIYVEVPFLQGFHADPYDYQRYTLEGLKILFSKFKEIKCGVSVGPFCTIVWIIRDGLSSCFKNKYLYLSSRFILGWILSPLRYFDYLIRNNNVSIRLANEFYFFASKNKD